MQESALEMLVDHYPLRNLVLAGCNAASQKAHTANLLAEAMAGSEVLLLTSGDIMNPLKFTIDEKIFFVAGTSPNYLNNPFVAYLGERVIGKPVHLNQIDTIALVHLAVELGNIDGILFDLNIQDDDDDAVTRAMLNSMLPINDFTRRMIQDVNSFMGTNDQKYSTLPPFVLTVLAREPDQGERRKTLSAYLSHCGPDELSTTVVFKHFDDAEDEFYTTLPRGVADRMRRFPNEGLDQREETFVAVTVFELLKHLAGAGATKVNLDSGTVVSGRMARSVLTANGEGW